MRLLVTGTGRCGTTWLAEALRMAGVDCGHERAFNFDRHGERPWVAECSWLAAPFTPLDDTYVVHLVRHPLPTIRSRAAWGTFGGEAPRNGERRRARGRFAMNVVPEIADGVTPLERAALHYVLWNRLVVADERIRIEDVGAATVERLARIVDSGAYVTELPPTTVNKLTLPAPELTWDQVGRRVRELAKEYGYPCEP